MNKYYNEYKDFPKKGIIFRDYMKCFENGSYKELFDSVKYFLKYAKFDYLCPIETRGFLMTGIFPDKKIIPLRKKGKLPGKTISQKYKLEYGEAELEMHKMNLKGKTVLILDDILATGGTINAAIKLLKKCKVKYIYVLVIDDLKICDRKELLTKKIFSIIDILNF